MLISSLGRVDYFLVSLLMQRWIFPPRAAAAAKVASILRVALFRLARRLWSANGPTTAAPGV